ncbi:MAG TPA: flagellar hook-associated protein FlgK [Bryobacteraceae bacterium]|nr:flagellar hook-associated protein FlgK [Bryobacteraceae bacterium]
MGNLLTTLLNSANALGVYSRALEVTENNVTNANTPGYAKQIQSLTALPFDPAIGLPGGVGAGPMQSTRNAYAERSVQQEQSANGYQQHISNDLSQLQGIFDPSSDSGLSTDINKLFSTFSALSINPNDTVTRQTVLDQAKTVAQSFQNVYSGLANAAANVRTETGSAVDAVNQLASQIADINRQRSASGLGTNDAGTDAALNEHLEELSQWVNFSAIQQPDGTLTLYIGGQTPLVVGDQAFSLKADFSAPQAAIVNSQDIDVTSEVVSGKLAGMLQVANVNLPSYTSDLNTLAKSVADQVNTTLSDGVDEKGADPQNDLFTYDTKIGAAATIDTNNLTPSDLAAALPTAPGGNGNALALAQLGAANSTGGYTFAQFYGNIAGHVGSDLSDAQDAQNVSQQLLTQAQTIRQQISGVSLDEEATHLIQFQRAYQAVSEMLTVLNDLTGTVLNILPTS